MRELLERVFSVACLEGSSEKYTSSERWVGKDFVWEELDMGRSPGKKSGESVA